MSPTILGWIRAFDNDASSDVVKFSKQPGSAFSSHDGSWPCILPVLLSDKPSLWLNFSIVLAPGLLPVLVPCLNLFFHVVGPLRPNFNQSHTKSVCTNLRIPLHPKIFVLCFPCLVGTSIKRRGRLFVLLVLLLSTIPLPTTLRLCLPAMLDLLYGILPNIPHLLLHTLQNAWCFIIDSLVKILFSCLETQFWPVLFAFVISFLLHKLQAASQAPQVV